MIAKIFCDMDGVLVDFQRGILDKFGVVWPKERLPQDEFEAFHNGLFSQIAEMGPKFWDSLPPMSDALELYYYIRPLCPSILTAWPHSYKSDTEKFDCSIGKRVWIEHNLDIHTAHRFNICYAKEKQQFVGKDPRFSYILIDDMHENIRRWELAGGIGIIHTSAKDTIAQLRTVLGNQKEAA